MDTLPVPVDRVVEQDVEDGILLLRDTGDYLIVNATGRMVWKHLRESSNLDALLDLLTAQPGAPDRPRCREIVLEFVHDLLDAGFVREQV